MCRTCTKTKIANNTNNYPVVRSTQPSNNTPTIAGAVRVQKITFGSKK